MRVGRLLPIVLACFIAVVLIALGLPAGCRWNELGPDVSRATATTVRELSPAPGQLALPLRDGSIRFAVIGDSGRGDRWQQEVADQMVAWRARFPFDFVLMLGDNIYGGSTAADYDAKFEQPYRALLDAKVTFHAAIGNHDDPEPDPLRPVQHGRAALLHVPQVRAPPLRPHGRGRPVLRARQPVARSHAARVAGPAAGRVGDGVEDRLLPPSDLHVGSLPCRRARASPRARAHSRGRRRRRRAGRSRARLRAGACRSTASVTSRREAPAR